MKTFTTEQLETLKQYEDRLISAYRFGYYRNLGAKALETIKQTYLDAGGDTNFNGGCGKCTLDFLAKVGRKYAEDKKIREEEAKKLVEILDAVFEEVEAAETTPQETAEIAESAPQPVQEEEKPAQEPVLAISHKRVGAVKTNNSTTTKTNKKTSTRKNGSK